MAAVGVALWQSWKARRDALSEQQYRNWLEQKRLEEQHLTRALQVLREPFRVATDFFFSGTRLLAGIPTHAAPTPAQNQQVLDFIERFAHESGTQESAVSTFINIVGALRELHRTRGETAEAADYDKLIEEVTNALSATSDLREWLADPSVIRSIQVDTFEEHPLVSKAREATEVAERSIGRRLVRLYQRSPGG